MSKKSVVASFAIALAGLAAVPVARAADAPSPGTPAGAEQKQPAADQKKDAGSNPCGPMKAKSSNPCAPAKRKGANPCGPSNPCGPRKKKPAAD